MVIVTIVIINCMPRLTKKVFSKSLANLEQTNFARQQIYQFINFINFLNTCLVQYCIFTVKLVDVCTQRAQSFDCICFPDPYYLLRCYEYYVIESRTEICKHSGNNSFNQTPLKEKYKRNITFSYPATANTLQTCSM